MMHSMTSGATIVATFADYNVAILCLPAVARAVGAPVQMVVCEEARRTVSLPKGVMADFTEEKDGKQTPVLIARP